MGAIPVVVLFFVLWRRRRRARVNRKVAALSDAIGVAPAGYGRRWKVGRDWL